jgi:hypothetical protein
MSLIHFLSHPTVTGTPAERKYGPAIGSNQHEMYFINWTTAGTGWLQDGGGIAKTYDPKFKLIPH